MYHTTSHLHGKPLVSLQTVEMLSTITPTALDRGPVFETVPELRDRLAVMLVTATKHYSPAGRRSTTHFVVGTLR